jgi:TolA-binding protein
MPSWYYNVFKKLHDKLRLFLGGGYTTSNSHSACPSQENLNKIALDTTTSLQELNKEFYLFAGKWQPHMTEHATLDIDKMRQTIIENSNSIQDLSGKNRELEQQNKKLEAELQELKEQKAILEKEKTRLLPLEKYKDAVLEFMDEHYTRNEHNERWLAHVEHDDDDKPIDTDIIKYFGDWHANKVFMDEWEYDNVMESKEELNEYRIYKKVKGEMVSNGMDNSSVARNVRSIKKTINKSKS